MKSYSVKSNAKRFARGIAKQFGPLYVPAEPLPAPGSLGSPKMWFPAVDFIGRDFADIPEEVRATCVINNELEGDGISVSLVGLEPEEDASGLKAMFDAVEPAGDIDIKAHATPEMIARGELVVDFTFPATAKAESVPVLTLENSTFIITASGRKMLQEAGAPVLGVPESLAAMAASLPPRVESSRAEIDRRRAERRARIEAEKAAGTRTSTGDKVKWISKKKKILDLIARPNGATQAELEAATGWQRHTLRGYIAGTLRKTLAPVGVIECRKGKGVKSGEPSETRYVFVKHAKPE